MTPSPHNSGDLVPFSGRQLAAVGASPGNVPAIFLRTEGSARRFWEFFTANIRNRNTRKAYFVAVSQFSTWCEKHKLTLESVQPIHVAGYIEHLGQFHSKPTVKQHLAAIRMLFDWLVTGQIIPSNPAHSVRGPRHSVKKGKTSVLSAEEMGALLASIDITTLIGLRDRALIGLMGYSFAGVGAAVGLKVEDYFIQKRRGWIRLHEKGGKVTDLPCHHNLEQFLDEWLDRSGLSKEPEAPLFPTLRHGKLTGRTPLPQANVHMMIQRRARAADIRTKISCHSFRATGITTYLQNGGKLEVAQQMAGHESARTTGLYDRRDDTVALDEVERVVY
ncbi:MAG TPA: tyrosine-type recombinase/integrase [Bryobacteraceae bacterium]|jgi:site-specific recombinase XerD|nr:tyrosine-type recombinase/integrase [Bryobacteraceae bacterium]